MHFTPHIDSGGIHILSKISLQFEEIYLKVLHKENRIYSDAEVNELPKPFFYNLHRQEWEMRTKHFQRLRLYLKKLDKPLKIMDLGCGNGWLANQLAEIPNTEIWGVDINLSSLQQARRVCTKSNVHFAYGDIYSDLFDTDSFDMIILNRTIEFFPNLPRLINRCRNFLPIGGEIHILDSPIFAEKELDAARQKTFQNFETVGVPEMSVLYFHHSRSAFQSFDNQFLYTPSRWKRGKDSPYPWIRILN